MPKTKYIATDKAGGIHTRQTARTYTHTVVRRGGYQTALSWASDKSWARSDARDFAYWTQIADGNDPYPQKCYCTPERDSAEQIAEEAARVAAQNEKRVAAAKAEIEGHTVESYVAGKLAKRLADIEKRRAAGFFDTWGNVGWCGRLALAVALAAKECGNGDYETDILDAREA